MRSFTISLILLSHFGMLQAAVTEEPNAPLKGDSSVERSCLVQVQSAAAKQPSPAPALARWLVAATASPGYCSCVAASFSRKVEQNLSEPESQQLQTKSLRESAQECAVDLLKAELQPYCMQMISEYAPASASAESVAEIAKPVCSCMRTELEPLRPEGLARFTSATVRDYEAYRRLGTLPETSSNSLVAAMTRCGFQSVREKLKR